VATIPPILDLGVRDPQFWLDAANESVRSFCGWHVAPVITQTLRLDGSGGHTLLLPSRRLLNVVSCTSDGVDVLNRIDPSTAGMVQLRDGRWSSRLGGVTITIEHGHETAPDVAGVIASAAARGPMPAGIAQQSVGPASVRYGSVAIPLLAEEKATLEPYRLTWGA